IGTEPGTFADLATLRKQIAANFNDYCDSDGVPASDIAADTWVNDLLGKAPEVDAVTGDRKFRHPAFTGNEKTPYLYELGMNFSLVPNKAGVVKTLSTAKQDDGSYLIEADLKAAPIVKLCNIYPFDPEESSATGRLYQDFNTGDFMRAYVDFDEMAIKFKLRKITLKGVTFNYTVKTVDNSVSPAEENTFTRTLKCDMTVEWSGTGSEVDAADLVKEFSYYGKEWKRAGAADAVTGATEVEPLIFAAADLKNSSAEKPYPLKHSSAADDKSLQKLTAIAHTDTVTYPGMTINYTFDNVDHFFSTDSTGGLVYPLKDGVTLGNTAAGSTGTVDEFTVPESNSNKTKTISNFTMNVDTATLQVDAIRLTSVSLKPARMFLTANARMGSEFKERGVDYTGDLDPLEISGLTVDADFSAAADGAHPGFVVGAFRNSDPRQNLNKGDWSKDAAAVNAVADYAKPDPATEIPLVMKTTGANPDSPKYLVTETGKNMDNETVEEPAYKGAGSHISTAVIRNAPMMSPWEIGFIHRGVKWQTINLKNASIHSFDDNGSEWGKTAGASSYDGGDGGILEQIKMTDQVRTYGKINVNVLRPRHQDYCPEDMDIARVLFRNLRYGEDPWKFIANSTRDSSGKFPTAVASGAVVAHDTAAVNFLGDTARG
ncbi:MAG: hypothetical protein IKB74_03355, partial [Lentisphaeria bacterium]|nr:hypothetical protein [Lentisphaeria bacterium]